MAAAPLTVARAAPEAEEPLATWSLLANRSPLATPPLTIVRAVALLAVAWRATTPLAAIAVVADGAALATAPELPAAVGCRHTTPLAVASLVASLATGRGGRVTTRG